MFIRNCLELYVNYVIFTVSKCRSTCALLHYT